LKSIGAPLSPAGAAKLTDPQASTLIQASRTAFTPSLISICEVEALDGGFKIVDSNGQALAYVYGHADQRNAQIVYGLTLDEAGRIASNIAKLPSIADHHRKMIRAPTEASTPIYRDSLACPTFPARFGGRDGTAQQAQCSPPRIALSVSPRRALWSAIRSASSVGARSRGAAAPCLAVRCPLEFSRSHLWRKLLAVMTRHVARLVFRTLIAVCIRRLLHLARTSLSSRVLNAGSVVGHGWRKRGSTDRD
jgi:hypothetical protein